jgi:hypothetical protein
MKIRYLAWLFLGSLALICGGCRTAKEKPHVTRDLSVDFSVYRTFAILPVETKPGLDVDTARKVVVAAEGGARDALRNAGYSEAGRGDADLVFYLHGKVLAPVPIASMGYQPAPEAFGITSSQIARTFHSHIFVEGYDNHTKRQVWMDWVECTCTHVVPSRIEGEIHHVLEGFPVRERTISLAE